MHADFLAERERLDAEQVRISDNRQQDATSAVDVTADNNVNNSLPETRNLFLDGNDESYFVNTIVDYDNTTTTPPSEQVKLIYRTFPAWHASGTMYGTAVQVHFLFNPDDSAMPICVILFTKTFQNVGTVFGCCLAESCDRLGTNLAQYGIHYEHLQESDLTPFPSCQHIADAAMCILHAGDVDTADMDDNLLMTSILAEMYDDDVDLSGVYASAKIFSKHGRPVLFVNSGLQTTTLFYSSSSWWCRKCNRGVNKPCTHIVSAFELINSGLYENIIDGIKQTTTTETINENLGQPLVAIDSITSVLNDFQRMYIIGKKLVPWKDDRLRAIGRSRSTGLREWLGSRFTLCYETKLHVIYPEATECNNCGGPLVNRRVDGFAYIFAVCYEAVVMYRRFCENNACEKYQMLVHYEGHDDGLCNYNDKTIIPHEHVFSYLRQFAKSGTAITAWWEELADFNWMTSLSNIQNLSKKQITDRRGQVATAIAGYLEKVRLNSCYSCCSAPKAISLDGIVLSVTRKSMPMFSRPWMMDSTETSRGSLRRERQLPELEKDEHDFLSRFKDVGCTAGELLDNAKSTENVALRLLCTMYHRSSDTNTCKLNETVKGFAKVLLSKVAPITNLLPHDQLESLQNLLESYGTKTRDALRDIQENAPFLFSLYFTIQQNENIKAKTMQMDLFRKLCEQIVTCREKTYYYNEDSFYQSVDEDEWERILRELPLKHHTNDELDELWSTGVYFPGRRICRKIQQIDISNRSPSNCLKLTVSDATMMPGVLLFYCLEHQNCIGFVVLPNAEGPRIVYEILATRFETPPEVVIYDNACNLSEYVLNRTPFLFRRTQFLVDEFHFKSHSICAPTFSTGQNPCITDLLNTSLTEQRNSKLARLNRTVPLMRSRVFFSVLRAVVAHDNDKTRERNKNRNENAERKLAKLKNNTLYLRP